MTFVSTTKASAMPFSTDTIYSTTRFHFRIHYPILSSVLEYLLLPMSEQSTVLGSTWAPDLSPIISSSASWTNIYQWPCPESVLPTVPWTYNSWLNVLNGCYKLIDGFRFFLKHLTKDMPLIWNIDLRSEVCIQHAKCLRVNSLLAVDRPGSVRVAKISWTSIPAECSRSDRFCFASLTPFPSTKDLKAVFHRFHHGPMLVMPPVQSKGLIPSISRFTAISTPDMKPLLSS